MNIKSKLYKIFIDYQLLFILLLIIDQVTKLLAYINLKDNSVNVLNLFSLELTINPYVAFSFGRNINIPEIAKTIIFVLISFGATFGIEYYLLVKKPQEKIFKVLLLILLAGALGNGIDRLLGLLKIGYHIDGIYGVVDFIYPTFVEFANFNFADICVTLSSFGIIAYVLLSKDDNEPSLSDLNKAKKELERLKKESESLEKHD